MIKLIEISRVMEVKSENKKKKYEKNSISFNDYYDDFYCIKSNICGYS